MNQQLKNIINNKNKILGHLYRRYPHQEVDDALSKVIEKVIESGEIVKNNAFWKVGVSRLLMNYTRDTKKIIKDPYTNNSQVFLSQSYPSYEDQIIDTPDYYDLQNAISKLPKGQRAAAEFFIKNGFLKKEGVYNTNRANFRHAVEKLKKDLKKDQK